MVRSSFALLLAALALAAVSSPASAADSVSRTSTSSRAGTAKGPLPDPALLDGRKEAPEKSSAVGMLGDFEIPGDENVRSGNVADPRQASQGQSGAQSQGGGQSAPGAQIGGGGSSGQNGQSGQAGGGQRQGQGASAGAQGQGQWGANAQGGVSGADGAAGAQGADGAANGAGSAGPNAAGGGPGGGDPGASADGVQVGGLTGDGSPQSAGGDKKSRQVTIGDSAMRIEAGPAVPGAVGAQLPPGPVQQHEKGTGSGGKGPSGSNMNKGVERGRSIPSGL
jgi:hypothetical protein